MSLESLLAYMGIDPDLVYIDEIHDFTIEPFEGYEFDCS